MRCLRAMLGVPRRDQLRNVEIRERLGISEHIGETIKERRLRWFGHVLRRPQESILGSAYSARWLHCSETSRQTPKRWKDQIAQDVGQPLRQCEAAARDREDWRERPAPLSQVRQVSQPLSMSSRKVKVPFPCKESALHAFFSIKVEKSCSKLWRLFGKFSSRESSGFLIYIGNIFQISPNTVCLELQ